MAREYEISPEVHLILPERSDDSVSDGLRYLTEVLCVNKIGEDTDGGGMLGGTYGYGVDFENETFALRPYYWGECVCGFEERDIAWSDEHQHAADCYQTELVAREKDAGVHWSQDTDQTTPYDVRRSIQDTIYHALTKKYGLSMAGCAVHCTCGHDAEYRQWVQTNTHALTCGIVAPNFEHKPSGSTIRWYKWIGRDNDSDLHLPWESILQDCLRSLGA